MATTIDATVEKAMDQSFADGQDFRRRGHNRLAESNDNVSEQSKLGYLTEQRVVGVREAKASTLLQPVVGQPVPVGLGGTVGIKTGA